MLNPVRVGVHRELFQVLDGTLGRLRSVRDSAETGCSCFELIKQLHAIENAIADLKRDLIDGEIDQLLVEAAEGPRPGRTRTEVLSEIKLLTEARVWDRGLTDP